MANMTGPIKLSKNFTFPAVDYATQGNAILGIRDAGKTYTAMKAAEELLENNIPILCYDPVGIWKNLRVGIGRHKGYPIVVAGGEGSDIRLNATNAVDIVRAAMKAGVSLVIDLYSPELINKSTWIKIVQETVDLLMYENKPYGVRHIFLEEAAEFIPQRLQPQHARVYASLERLARMGRNARLGMTIINQRAEEVNKAILEICAFSLVHKQVGKNSLKSIQQWLELRQLEDVKGIIKSLPGLKPGECWAIGQTDQPRKIQIAARNTHHPDPKNNNEAVINKMAVDVSAFVTKLNAQLVKPVAKLGAKIAAPGNDVQKQAIQDLRQENQDLRKRLTTLEKHFNAITNSVNAAQSIFTQTEQKENQPHQKAYDKKYTQPHAVSAPSLNGNTASGAMRMLKAAAMYYPNSITKFRMAALARLSHSSGSFKTYLSALKRDCLIDINGADFKITKEGLDKAGNIEPLPKDPDKLIDLWCNVIGPESGAARMLRVLGQGYPDDYSKEDLGKEVGMSHTSGSFKTYLSTLKRNGLIKIKDNWVKASEELFN